MPSASLGAIIPLLVALTGPGAGLVAYYVIELGRRHIQVVEPQSQPVRRAMRRVLTTPRYTRFAAIALSIVVSVVSSGLLALINGEAVLTAMDTALAAALAPLVNQLIHGFQLSSRSIDEPLQLGPGATNHIVVRSSVVAPPLSDEEVDRIISRIARREAFRVERPRHGSDERQEPAA